jgi:hypothetical protein
MAFSAGQILQKWFRQIIRWPLEALFGFGLFYFARLLPVRFASAVMGRAFGDCGTFDALASPRVSQSHPCHARSW